MTGAAVLAGGLLIAPVAFSVVEMVGYRRGHFGRTFWESPLDAKLDHVGQHSHAWWLMILPWFPILAVTTAGLAGLSFLLADVTGWAAFGVFMLAAEAWLIVLSLQNGTTTVAALRRAQTGDTPDWAVAVWQAGFVLERVWIVLANVAAVGYGVAVLRTDVLPGWLGWSAIVVGLAIPILVLLTRDGFPELALPVPLVLGIALLAT
ncbi:MAG TPA: hypothetical protein VIQ02_13300 [Jiangellaceae bacterium]